MVEAGVPQVEVERTMKLLVSRNFKDFPRPPPVEPAQDELMDQGEIVMVETPPITEFDFPSEDKKQNLHTLYSSVRFGLLGADPEERDEAQTRSGLLLVGNWKKRDFDTAQAGSLLCYSGAGLFEVPLHRPSSPAALTVSSGLQTLCQIWEFGWFHG